MGLFSRRPKKSAKAQAEEQFAKGNWSAALAAYEKLSEDPADDAKLLRRLADLRLKVGRRADAVETYRLVADHYAQGGFLVQAIAIYKILLRLDPTAEDVGAKLAALYAKRGMHAAAPPEARQQLPEIPLFSDLEADAFRGLVEKLVPRSLDAGDVLFHRGDPGDSIFVITSGAVRVSRGDLFLAELAEGTFFGEGAFFSHEPRNADVVAASDCELLEIRREDLEPLMESYPGVAGALNQFYRHRVLDGVLASSPLFGVLDEGERQQVAQKFTLRGVAAGEAVVSEGEPDRALYLIKSGRFQVATVPPGEGQALELATLGPGSFFGEVALLSRGERTATVTAVEPGEVLRVAGEDLDPVLDAHPEVRDLLERTRDERAADAVRQVLGRTH